MTKKYFSSNFFSNIKSYLSAFQCTQLELRGVSHQRTTRQKKQWPPLSLKLKSPSSYESLSKKIRQTGSFETKNGAVGIVGRSGCSKCVESRLLVYLMMWKKIQIFPDPENIFSSLLKNPDSHFTKEFCIDCVYRIPL